MTRKSQETAAFADLFRNRGLPAAAYRRLGRSGWTASTVGFGTYRVEAGNPAQAQALREAVQAGCNLFDTSTNYGDGQSEQAVGELLRRLEDKEAGLADRVIIVSKVGYVQGSNLADARHRAQSGRPFPEMVEYHPDCWHCLHPTFIEDQLTRSLERLGRQTVDVYLLHNPEYFFSDADAKRDPAPLEERRDRFYARIEAAFRHLESEVKRGRIRHYGVSSNTFGLSREDTEFTSLTRMWEIAELLARDEHHFSVVQLPANWLERGPFLEKNNGKDGSQTVVDFAREKDLAVLVNRPLNAILGGELVRLAALPGSDPGDLTSCLNDVSELEETFVTGLGSSLHFRDESASAKDLFRWGLDLVPERTARLSPDQWSYLESQVILPQTHDLLERLGPTFSESQRPVWNDWQRNYLKALGKLLSAIRFETTRRSRVAAERLSQALGPLLPEGADTLTLSQKAIATLAFTPGVSCVLNGMRKPQYVEDSLGVLKLEPWDVDARWYETLSKAL